jgi:cytochrome c553
MRSRTAVAAALVTLMVSAGCGDGGGADLVVDPASTTLSGTGLYRDIAGKRVSGAVRPWVPQYPLWSDGGAKERWIHLPRGTQIDTSDMDRWVFPVGTRIWKEFTFEGRRVETRLTEKVAAPADLASWTFRVYQWRADESDADLVTSPDAVKDVALTAFGTTHDLPSQANCKACHARGGDAVLGFDALQLSPDLDPLVLPDGERRPDDLTLDDLVALRLVTHAPTDAPRISASTANGRWVMGRLHGNCGNCHNPQGTAAFVGLHMRHETSTQIEADEPVFRTAVNQPTTQFAVPGTTLGVDAFRIKGGAPELSALAFRMESRNPVQQMPPIATKVVDAEGVARLREWISGLPKP